MEKFSFIISRIFDFYFWFPVLLLAAVFKTGLAAGQIKILLPTLLIVDVVIPISYFFMDLGGGRVSDIDVSKRQQRYHLFIRLVIIQIISTVFAYFFGNQTFFVLQLINLVLGTSILLITFFYKISGHMLLSSSYILMINFLFNWQFLWLFLILPFVAFARIYLKKHTVWEVLAGTTVGLIEPYLILRLFKLL